MTTYQVRLINKKRKIDITIPVEDDMYIIDVWARWSKARSIKKINLS